MKKLLLLLIISFTVCEAQICDYKINTEIYTGCFSVKYKNPTYIAYTLNYVNGTCDRNEEGFHFKDTTLTANAYDYAHSGYDEGHLANAKDFSFDCKKEKKTFIFFNCVPQTPNLNRGIWKKDETWLRDFSKLDPLFVVCGPGYKTPYRTIGKGLAVPYFCWKYAVSIRTGKVILCRLYTNLTSENISKDYTPEDLSQLIGFDVTKIK